VSIFRYVPVHLLTGEPHVIVDGAPRAGTAYTLSHWPRTPTPPSLHGDLSAEIVRAALTYPERRPDETEVVSVDHYDVDGVVALGLLVLEGLDTHYGPLLVEAARVGDFDVATSRAAALIAFALNALDDDTGQGDVTSGSGHPLERCGMVTRAALEILVDLAADPEGFESLWHDEWSAYEASVRALTEGWATIEEMPELDLAVVRVDADAADDGEVKKAGWRSGPLHPAAVHSATTALRVATLAGAAMEFHYRYESWVTLVSRRPGPRLDLDRLAHDLTGAETVPNRWLFDGAASTTGALHLARGEAASTVEPQRFLDMLCGRLAADADGDSAWDLSGSGDREIPDREPTTQIRLNR
jgi:hypothetical protein